MERGIDPEGTSSEFSCGCASADWSFNTLIIHKGRTKSVPTYSGVEKKRENVHFFECVRKRHTGKLPSPKKTNAFLTWTWIFWKSAKWLSSRISCHSFLFPQAPFWHIKGCTAVQEGDDGGNTGGIGSVSMYTQHIKDIVPSLLHLAQNQWHRIKQTSEYLNCWWTSSEEVPHCMHLNFPRTNSGRTSEVRVTVPVKQLSLPTCSVRNWRSFSVEGKLWKDTANSRGTDSTEPKYRWKRLEVALRKYGS